MRKSPSGVDSCRPTQLSTRYVLPMDLGSLYTEWCVVLASRPLIRSFLTWRTSPAAKCKMNEPSPPTRTRRASRRARERPARSPLEYAGITRASNHCHCFDRIALTQHSTDLNEFWLLRPSISRELSLSFIQTQPLEVVF